jgi:hypothetical protein
LWWTGGDADIALAINICGIGVDIAFINICGDAVDIALVLNM